MTTASPQWRALTTRRATGRAAVEDVLSAAGVRINGPDPWDLTVHDERFYDRVLSQGTLGLGESYMEGWWDSPALDQLMERVLAHGIKDYRPKSLLIPLAILRLCLLNLQSSRRSRKVAEVHYDLGNDFFARMLGRTMTYSCAYWRDGTRTLDEAQDRKLDLICDKLGLRGHHRLLDLGCGWGSLLAHAHRRTGCEGKGVTISEPQWRHASEAHRGLPLDFSLLDYRDSALGDGRPFDRIVSVGMFEHVGVRNHRPFFKRVAELLADDGLFVLQTIGNRAKSGADPWIDKYIFPNSVVPCVGDVAAIIPKKAI
jgi:cyclopropane-fatty-acyl-phospholipid synthase